MTYSICIEIPHGQSWQVPPDSTNIKEIQQAISESCESVNFLSSAVIPTRTKGLNYFIKDFFFPTLINRVLVLKINSFALKFLACLSALLFDCITFPFRLITSLPKALKDLKKEDHPLTKYLINQGAPSNLLKSGVLSVKIESIGKATVLEKTVRNETMGIDDIIFEVVQEKNTLIKEIFLIEMPFARAEDSRVCDNLPVTT